MNEFSCHLTRHRGIGITAGDTCLEVIKSTSLHVSLFHLSRHHGQKTTGSVSAFSFVQPRLMLERSSNELKFAFDLPSKVELSLDQTE